MNKKFLSTPFSFSKYESNFYPTGYFFSFFKTVFLLVLLLAAECVRAANITVGNYNGTNTNMSFNTSTRTWAPATSSDAQLDVASLITRLNEGNVTISTNGTGNITFVEGAFNYTATAARTLTLSATGNIVLSQIATTGSPVNYIMNASSNVSISVAGLQTNGGSVTSSGFNFNVNGNPIVTKSGNITLTHTGSVTVYAGGIQTGGGVFSSTSDAILVGGTGISTGGGKFYFEGGGLTVQDGGLRTGGGMVEIKATRSVVSSSLGIETGTAQIKGGKFSSVGTAFSATNNGIKTYGGDIEINHTGNVTIGSTSTGGGNFSSKGNTMTFVEGGLATNGGSVTLAHQGNVLATSSGINSGGGNFVSSGPGSFTANQVGINLGAAPFIQIVHAGISISQGGFANTNASSAILMHAACNPVDLDNVIANGNLKISGGAVTIGHITANGGKLNVAVTASSGIIINNSIKSNTGNVVLRALGAIELRTNTVTSDDPDGITTTGGNIEIRSKTSISSGNTPGLNTAPGTGGVLTNTATPSTLITLAAAPTLGKGNITLIRDAALTIPFGPGTTEICNGVDDDCDGSIDEGFSGCSALPVKLQSFLASKNEQTVLLEWTTTEEYNSESFDIERSLNGKNWTSLGTVKASGQSNSDTHYMFSDANPVHGNNFYRLKMIDFDNTFAYSIIRNVNLDKKSDLAIISYPNPVSDRVYIQMKDWTQVKTIQLIGANGQIIYDSFGKLVNQINVKNLATGVYVLRLTLRDGSVVTGKVVRE